MKPVASTLYAWQSMRAAASANPEPDEIDATTVGARANGASNVMSVLDTAFAPISSAVTVSASNLWDRDYHAAMSAPE